MIKKSAIRKQLGKTLKISSFLFWGIFGYVESASALTINGIDVGETYTRPFEVKEYCAPTGSRSDKATFSPADPNSVILDYRITRNQLWSNSGRTITEAPPNYRFSAYSEYLNEFNDLIDASGQDGTEEYRARYERERREFQQAVSRLEVSHSSIVVDWHCEGSGFLGARGKVDLVIEVTLMRMPSPDEVSFYLAESRQTLEEVQIPSQVISGNGDSNPSYIIETPNQPPVAVFERRRESFALGCAEIRDSWGVTDRRGVSLDEFYRVLNTNPVVADLPCDGSIQYMALSDEPPQLLWIRHRNGQMCRHYINSTNFPNALRSGNLQRNDGPSFRATYPCRGNDFQVVN